VREAALAHGRVAYHEMGHALVAASLPGVDPVHKVSIIPRGVGALGYSMQRPTEDRFVLARHDLANRIAVLMGGRASEALIFDASRAKPAPVPDTAPLTLRAN
jgi:cell division protease FtsH